MVARILSCVSSAKRGWSSAEKIDKSSRVNWMPNWRRTQFRSKKAIHLSMRSGSCRDVLSPAFRNTTKRDDAKRGDDLDREREKRERESDSKREKERCATDRPFCTFFLMQELMEIFLSAFSKIKCQKQPQKGALQKYLCREKRKTFINPLKPPPKKKKKRERSRERCSRRM